MRNSRRCCGREIRAGLQQVVLLIKSLYQSCAKKGIVSEIFCVYSIQHGDSVLGFFLCFALTPSLYLSPYLRQMVKNHRDIHKTHLYRYRKQGTKAPVFPRIKLRGYFEHVPKRFFQLFSTFSDHGNYPRNLVNCQERSS